MISEVSSIKELLGQVNSEGSNLNEYLTGDIRNSDLIIVEGFDGVGKSTLIKELESKLELSTYRPDYNYWNNHLDRDKRWIMCRSIIEYLSSIEYSKRPTMIMDRGMVSGSVYNDDPSITEDFYESTRDLRVIIVLVTTDLSSFNKMQLSRNGEVRIPYEVYERRTSQFIEYMDKYNIPYVKLNNLIS